MLTLGNFLNGGATKGLTYGFKLTALSKMVDTKTIDNKSSLMHYLVRLLKDKFKSEVNPIVKSSLQFIELIIIC